MLQNVRDRVVRLLRWSEQYTRADMLYLASGGTWLTIAQVVSTALALGGAIVCANFLTKDTYGLYKYLLAIGTLLAIFALPGMTSSLTRAVARGFAGSIAEGVKTCMRWSVLGTVVGCAIAVYYYTHGNITLAISFLIMSLLLPAFDPFSNFTAYFLGKPDFRGNALTTIFVQSGATLALIAAIFLNGSIYALLIAYFGSYAVLYFVCYVYTLHLVGSSAPVDPQAISYGKHLSVMGILGTIAGNIDQLVLFHFLGPVEVALYSVASAAPNQLKNVLSLMTTLFFPTFARGDETEVRKNMVRTFLLFFAVSATGAIVYVIAAPYLFDLLFHQYDSMIFVSQIFALSLVAMTFDPSSLFLTARGMVKEQYWSNTIGYLLQIGLVIALAIPYGLMGVVSARIITRFLGNFVNLYFYFFPFKR